MDAPLATSYAGFWKRFLAFIIDGIIVGIGEAIIFIPVILLLGVGLFGMGEEFNNEDASPMLVGMILGPLLIAACAAFVLHWLYYAFMEASRFQGTLGKMALGVVVTDMQGNKITFGRATGRYFGKIVSGMILYIGYIMAGFTQQKQALHDIMAGCLVVNK